MEYTQEKRDEIARLRLGGIAKETQARDEGISESTLDEWTRDFVVRCLNASPDYDDSIDPYPLPVFECATNDTSLGDKPIGHIDTFNPDMNPNDYFGLLVCDESMEPYIRNCSIAIVKKQDRVKSGDCAVIQIGRKDLILRNVQLSGVGLVIEPNNKNFLPAFYKWSEAEKIPVKILGDVVEIRTFI